MADAFGICGPSHPLLGELGYRISLPPARVVMWTTGFHRPNGKYARARARAMRRKLDRGEPVYLLGIGVGSHNAGVSLTEVTREGGVRLLCSNEEERYLGVKHYGGFPRGAIEDLLFQMKQWDVRPEDIHACMTGFDHATFFANGIRTVFEELPASASLLLRDTFPDEEQAHVADLLEAPSRLARMMGVKGHIPIIGLRHHDNHAYFSYAASPFAQSKEPVIISVVDGTGDESSVSFYLVQNGELRLIRSNRSLADSLGGMYRVLSSTQGGWTPLSSEGRYMGATAWGNNDRMTNPYYRQLRQLMYFGSDGSVLLNRALADWHRKRYAQPYTEALREILGPPIRYRDMWNPDAVLKLDDSLGEGMVRERLDKAAAVQMLFEDALFHMIGHLIQATGSSRLVLTGGTALNCVANMRLLENFDEAYYERYLGQRGVRLHIWVPPVPSDSGIPAGAAFNFALSNGAEAGESLKHAFYCGSNPTSSEVRSALSGESEIGHMRLEPSLGLDDISDLIASLVSNDAVVGVFQGVAETGPRALGHRSIVANPRNPSTQDHLNARVKFREPFRPLAPMVTYEAAQELFELSPGAADDDHNAYNYMVLTARLRSGARRRIPAVVHIDGTSRLQIVRQDTDPFTHAYLKALGRRLGEEVSVNTSLNVGSPIVQTPRQALATLKRAKGMDGLLMLGDRGDAYLAWHDVDQGFKDAGKTLRDWVSEWKSEYAQIEA